VNTEQFVEENLVRDIFHFDLDFTAVLNYVYKQIDEYNNNEDNEEPFKSGEIKMSEPLMKKYIKAFTAFQKKNEIPFAVESAPAIHVVDYDKAGVVTQLCDSLDVCSSTINMVLEDHTHSTITFYPTLTSLRRIPKDAPSYEFFCGEGQTHILNNKILHQIKTKQRGKRIILTMRLSAGYHRLARFV